MLLLPRLGLLFPRLGLLLQWVRLLLPWLGLLLLVALVALVAGTLIGILLLLDFDFNVRRYFLQSDALHQAVVRENAAELDALLRLVLAVEVVFNY